MMRARLFAAALFLSVLNVVRIAHANDYVFMSNEADVMREMRAFTASLP
jgi:hypothetical protein